MAAEQKITLSVIKADVGGWVGHSTSHPDLLALAQEHVDAAVKRGLLVDGQVLHVGDDVELIMTHHRGDGNSEVHQFAWDTFLALTELAKRMKLYGAGQDMLGLPQRKIFQRAHHRRLCGRGAGAGIIFFRRPGREEENFGLRKSAS